MLDIESMDVAQAPLVCTCAQAIFIHSITHTFYMHYWYIYGMSLCSMKSVIDRYGRAKEEQQLVANPNTELKVCHYK